MKLHIIDYPEKITNKKITEEDKKNLEIFQDLMSELRKTHDIKIVMNDKIYNC